MLQSILIGNLGADAVKQSKDGREFTTFRVAHNDNWTDAQGNKQTRSQWVDCILNGHPAVADYLKRGTTVCVMGSLSTRIYSSEKDRCMKAGITINVRNVELLGGSLDDVPRRLYDSQGNMHNIYKAYYTDVQSVTLMDQRNNTYTVDDKRYVHPNKPTDANYQQLPNDAANTEDRSGENAPVF